MCFRRRASRAVFPRLALAALLLPPALLPNSFARQDETASKPAAAGPAASNDGLVTLHVTVLDKRDAPVLGLPRESFEVYEGKQAREVTRFEREVPASVGIVMDTSGTFEDKLFGKRLEAVREGVRRFVRAGHPENRYFLVNFGTRVAPPTDWTGDADALASAVAPARSGKQTALYDACLAAVVKLSGGPHAKRVLLLISDGQDNASRQSLGDLRRLLRGSGVIVYAVSPRLEDSDHAYRIAGEAILAELAYVNGGVLLTADFGQGMLNAFGRAAEILRFQYTVGFARAAPEAKERWRKVRVKVQPPPSASARDFKDLRVIAGEGYLTPPSAVTVQTQKSN
ncbi:MAG TPA: VWA domain-containing protein [Pyrinomonadaceae bacterium]|nr:VWA domain-containing protein [Pyrinomonadaceae bacterium]